MMVWIQIWSVLLLYSLCSSFRTPPTSIRTTTTKHPYPQDLKWAEQRRYYITQLTTGVGCSPNFDVCEVRQLHLDLQDKFQWAMKVQDSYKGSQSYELGYLAAGIQETFKLMLEIYRTTANIKDFMNKTYNVEELLDAYHVIQGYYNDIRVQKKLYFDILEKNKKTRETREECWVLIDQYCHGARKKKFKRVPDDVLQNTASIGHNLRSYRVVSKCDDEHSLKKELDALKWPPPSRRQFTDMRDLINNPNKKEGYKVLKWSVKSGDFKAIDEVNKDLFT